MLFACSAAILIGLVVLYGARYHRAPSNASDSNPVLDNLALLEPNKLLAKVGDVELRSEDLRDVLQSDFHGQMSHAGLSPEDLGSKVGRALDALVHDELLAQAARLEGLKTNLKGSAGRKDLANQSSARTCKVPAVDEAALRNFYKNHGEKFVIPHRVQVRELFLPLQSPPDKKDKTKDKAVCFGTRAGGPNPQGEESRESLASSTLPGNGTRPGSSPRIPQWRQWS